MPNDYGEGTVLGYDAAEVRFSPVELCLVAVDSEAFRPTSIP